MLCEADKRASQSMVKDLTPKVKLIARLQFAGARRYKYPDALWSDEAKIEVFDHNDQNYFWMSNGEAEMSGNTMPTSQFGMNSIIPNIFLLFRVSSSTCCFILQALKVSWEDMIYFL